MAMDALCREDEGSDGTTMRQAEPPPPPPLIRHCPWTITIIKSCSVAQRKAWNPVQSVVVLRWSKAAAVAASSLSPSTSPPLRLLGSLGRSDEAATTATTTVSSSQRNNTLGTSTGFIATTAAEESLTAASRVSAESTVYSSVILCQCQACGHCCSIRSYCWSSVLLWQLAATPVSTTMTLTSADALLHLICPNRHNHHNVDLSHQANTSKNLSRSRHSNPPLSSHWLTHHQINHIRCQLQMPSQISIKWPKVTTAMARPTQRVELIDDTRQSPGSFSSHLPNQPDCCQLFSSSDDRHLDDNGARTSTSSSPSAQSQHLDCNSLSDSCSVTYLSFHSSSPLIAPKSAFDLLLPSNPSQSAQSVNNNNNNNHKQMSLNSNSTCLAYEESGSTPSTNYLWKYSHHSPIMVLMIILAATVLLSSSPSLFHLLNVSSYLCTLYLSSIIILLLSILSFIVTLLRQQQSCYFYVQQQQQQQQQLFATRRNLAKVSKFFLHNNGLLNLSSRLSLFSTSICNLLFNSQCQLQFVSCLSGSCSSTTEPHCTAVLPSTSSTISQIIADPLLSLLQSLYLTITANRITQFAFETRTNLIRNLSRWQPCRTTTTTKLSPRRCNRQSYLKSHLSSLVCLVLVMTCTLVSCSVPASSQHVVDPATGSAESNPRLARRALRPVGLRSSHGLTKLNYTYFEEKDNDIYFSHMAINVYTGHIYIGAVNGIYQLNSQLTLEAKATLGPQEDSVECPATKSCPNVNKKLSNYYNKALVIDYVHSWLISCGSLYQGACMTHRLDNVSHFLNQPSESVVANNSTASTVAFIAPGPPPHKQVLYIGATYTQGNYRSDVPAVSSRSLIENSLFQFAAADVSTGTRLVVNSLVRDRYPISYIYGFHSRGFSYFLTVQKSNVEGQKPFISKLVRICQKDSDYYSYTEVPLVCRSPHGKYNLAQAAFVGKPGSELANAMGITPQDDLLFVVFSRSREDLEDNHPTAQSALCVYPLLTVHRIFTQNIQHCFNGNGNQGLDFINILQKCVSTQVQINEDFCGMDVNQPLGGTLPIETEPAITFDNVMLTSVAATSTHDYTVVFLGTSTGHLKKVVVEASKHAEAHEFSDIVIQEGSPINQDMSVVAYDKYLYVMTRRRVTMVKVQECHIYRNCMDCLGAHNPYCGWCSLENKCSLRSACAEAASDPLYWLSYKSGKCTTITSVNPPQIQRTTTRTLNLVIDNLPVLEGRLLCVFTTQGKTQVTNATRSSNGVSCPTPSTDTLPQIPQGHHSFTSKLSVRMKDGPDFVATNFTFYHCASYTSCTTCVSSSFPCDWCVGGHRCTHDTGENCRNEILVTGLKSVGPSIRSGPSFCPRINSTAGGSTEILVPNGISKRISVKVVNIPQSTISIRFVCQFNIEGRVKQVNAQLLSDTIYCEPLVFSYVTNQTNITAPFAVIWDGNKPLDNPDNIHVLVYRCQGLASNCGFCLELEEKYGCGWCQKGDSCEVHEQCQHHNTVWLNRQQTCPNPQITDFYPKSGPYEGGTNLTIEGINLGRVYEDIENGIGVSYDMNGKRVSLVPCIPYPEEYVKTSRIKCRIQGPRNFTSNHQLSLSISGHVVVRVLTEYSAKSRDLYTFVNPKILTINPSKGPVSGGTLLSFEGLNLNAGSSAEAFLGNLPCNVTRRTINHAECITSGRGYSGEEQVRVKFDNGNRYFEYYKFLYVEDPKIFSVESGSGGNRGDPRGIPSGGISIVVKGENMNIIQKPQIYIELDSEYFASNCSTTSASDMKCESPPVPLDKLDLYWSDKEYIELDYGFLMDGVRSVRSLTTRPDKPFGKFRMYRNPDFQFFTEENGIKFYRGEYLTINGRNLEGIAQDTDVTVWVGSEICNVTSLSRIQLTCRLPSTRPPAENENYERTYDLLPAVIVGVGRRLNITLGRLSYDASSSSGSFFSFSPTSPGNFFKHVFIVIVIGICILFVVVVVILILYRRKSTESSRVLKTMQEQMDVLELRVASEAKEAFAELQTEITDITQEINVGGIPFLDYRLYTLKVLFPNADDHAVLRDLSIEPNERPHVERALQMFGQLIMNKTFLLLFIRTLESNRYFSMRDRVNVASLIMVTLQSKMEYCTSILKTLLAELIEKCIDGKSHPKLLLRRTESVAEKMLSSWFTFLLYKFLKECAGEPLYLLYFAIKHQVEKGPVDEITSEARYSLSEEKLIRQQIDYKQITVYASIQSAYAPNLYGASLYEQSQLPYPQQAPPAQTVLYGQTQIYSSLPTSDFIEVQVKVLDCDTISQVKEKALDTIYRGVPFSARPFREDELDLEWRTGQAGKLTLSNDDTTSRASGEWRRLNTLAHYKVPDNGSLTLVPNAKQQSLLYNTIDYMSIAGPDKMATLGGGSSSSSSGFAEKHRYEPLNHFIKSGGAIGGIVSNSPPSSLSRPTSPPTNNHYNHHQHGEYENGTYHQRNWHLVKHHDNDHGKESERGNKMVSEIYLTRLLATKGTLQKYVDDLFETIFSTAHRGSSLPLAIKYMFDFLDDQASHHSIHDSEVVHTWKSNSLPLRFWVNLIKNPNFVFDINKSNIVDSCLSVVAQTFMDACSTSDHRLGKDSPSSKLLYAKDIPIYKEWVDRYYKEIETMPSISDHDMNAMLAEESRQHSHEFNTNVALHELYKYAYKYKDQLLQTLNDDEFAVKSNLPIKLERVYDTMAGDEPL